MIRARTLTWHPRGLSDAVDGTSSFAGAMSLLSNLVPDPATRDVFVCRPAQTSQIEFHNLSGLPNAGFISAYFVVGDIVYGLIATSTYAGKDQPFAYDLANGVFLSVSGVTAANVPTSPPTTGAWTPPIMDQVAQRVLVTHPGFPGDAIKFGWFDISGLVIDTTGNIQTAVTFTGDTDTGNPGFIVGNPVTQTNTGYVFTNNGDPVPFQTGEPVSGTGIPANTTLVSPSVTKTVFTGDTTATSTTILTLTINGTLDTTGIYVGQILYGDGIPQGATVVSINRGAHSMVISAAATKTQVTNSLSALGTQLSLSQHATATNDGVTFTVTNNLITGNPDILGVQPGHAISGTGIPANTTVIATHNIETQLVGSVADGSNIVTAAGSVYGITVGMVVDGPGVVIGTKVATVDIPNFTISLTQPIAGVTGFERLVFSGTTIEVNKTLTGPHNNIAVTITGGTPTTPQWAAGDTMTNPLPSQPVAVVQMNARAWFACGVDGIPYSDAGFGCIRSNIPNVQALKPGNGLPVTCFGKLQLSNVLGGIVQGLIAFQRDANMLQITGDQDFGNLQMNNLPVGTGTHAPLSVFSSHLGVGFISPLGLRFINFSGQLTEPIGQQGDGITAPFILANNPPLGGPIDPSRICAACNGNTIRITTPTQSGISLEFWFDINRKIWTGPHTCPNALIQVWSDTYLCAPVGRSAVLVRSDDIVTLTTTYIEHNSQLDWSYAPVLLPDNQAGVMNAMVEATVALALPVLPGAVKAMFVDEGGEVQDQVWIVGTQPGPREYFTWNAQIWGAEHPAFQQRTIDWSEPIVFKQGRVILTGTSTGESRIGNLYLKTAALGYQVARPAGYIPVIYDSDTGRIITNEDTGAPLINTVTAPLLNEQTGEVLMSENSPGAILTNETTGEPLVDEITGEFLRSETPGPPEPLTQEVEAPY